MSIIYFGSISAEWSLFWGKSCLSCALSILKWRPLASKKTIGVAEHYGPIPSRPKLSENFEGHWSIPLPGEIQMDQSLVHTFSWWNSYGQWSWKFFKSFPYTGIGPRMALPSIGVAELEAAQAQTPRQKRHRLCRTGGAQKRLLKVRDFMFQRQFQDK